MSSRVKRNHAQSWKTRLWGLTEAWSDLSPGDAITAPHASPRSCAFVVSYPIVPGVDFAAEIVAWQIGESEFSIRVRGRLKDYRVSALVSFVEGLEFNLQFADFDVLAAACMIEKRPIHPSPILTMSCSDSEIREVLADYHAKLNRIWGHIGGRDLRSFEALAMWIVRDKPNTGTHTNDLGQVFAAFIYGERELARELLANFVEHWRRRASEEADDDAVLQIWNNVQAIAAKARLIVT